MNTTPTQIPDVLLIEPDIYHDPRGYFLETFHARRYEELGIKSLFVQDNLAFSEQERILRGLHYQLGQPQAKLVSVIQGEVFDVAVDIRRGSPTFGSWVSEVLSSENYKQFLIPQGFAHGYCVTKAPAIVVYKCSDYYSPAEERGILWNDPDLAIDWPISTPLLSEKDKNFPTLRSMPREDLPEYREDRG